MAVAAGQYHTCAVASGSGLWCWGDNSNGQLGINSTAQQISPVAVSLGEGKAPIVDKISKYDGFIFKIH